MFSLPLIIPSVLDSVNEGYLNGAGHSLLAATGHFVDADELAEMSCMFKGYGVGRSISPDD